jgi:hypothetical protein
VLTLRNLIKSAWPVSTAAAIRLACVVKELTLTADEATALMDRLLDKVLPAMELEAVPPFVYLLLQFSSSFSANASVAAGASATRDKSQLRSRVLRGVLRLIDVVDGSVDAPGAGSSSAGAAAVEMSQPKAAVRVRTVALVDELALDDLGLCWLCCSLVRVGAGPALQSSAICARHTVVAHQRDGEARPCHRARIGQNPAACTAMRCSCVMLCCH